jgi:hypothetical protein
MKKFLIALAMTVALAGPPTIPWVFFLWFYVR